MLEITCWECDSKYRLTPTGQTRGTGKFECQVCGEEIFFWSEDDSVDYTFELIYSPKEE